MDNAAAKLLAMLVDRDALILSFVRDADVPSTEAHAELAALDAQIKDQLAVVLAEKVHEPTNPPKPD